jgi:hypothetical protein
LEPNPQVLQDPRDAGQVSDEEFKTFQAIIEMARSGRWEEAESEALAFQKAQRPHDEHVRRVSHHRE